MAQNYTQFDLNQGFPGSPQNFTDASGTISQTWYQFFLTLYYRTGGASVEKNLTNQLDASIGTDVGSFVYRAAAGWAEFPVGAEGNLLQIKNGLPVYAPATAMNYGQQPANTFLAGPAGGAGLSGFRTVVSSDLQSLGGQYPGTSAEDAATAGNIGEFQTVNTAMVALATGVVSDIGSITLSAGDWDVWANIATAPDDATMQSQLTAWLNTVSATDPSFPNDGAYLMASSQVPAGMPQAAPIGSMRLSLPGAATKVWLSAKATFAGGNLSALGSIQARRRR